MTFATKYLEFLRDAENEGAGGGGPAPADDPTAASPEAAAPDASPVEPAPDAAPADPIKDTSDWRDQMAASVPDDVRKKFRKQLDGFDSPASAGQRLHEMQKAFDKRVAIPGDDATEEDKQAFAEKMGWIPDADAYSKGYERPEFADETFGKDVLDAQEGEFFKIMHEAKMPKAQATAAIDAYYTMQEAQQEALEKHGAEVAKVSQAALKEEYGAEYDENMTLAKRFLDDMGAGDLLERQLTDGALVGDLVPIVKSLVAASRSAFSEDRLIGDAMSEDRRNDIQGQIDTLISDNYGKDSYNSKAVQGKLTELYQKLHGTAPADGRAA